jgi:exopolyphosphatase/guanosine-5'-triphosphate,3'-diphosphate pyrophosphatase
MVIAGADFGSNKVGYIVAEAKGGGLETIERESRFTRLAEGVGETNRLSGEAMARTLLWCNEMRKRFKKLRVEKFRGVGTEALRRATNTPDFLELIEPILGWPVEVVSGEEEARLTFSGVRTEYPKGPLAIIDIGGGSTEVVVGGDPPKRGREPAEVFNSRLGAVVLTERCGERWNELVRVIRGEIRSWAPKGPLPAMLTVLGGTGANLTMMDLDDHDVKDEHIEGHVIELHRLEELRKLTQAMTPKQRVEKLGLLPQRADIQLAGLAVLETIMDHLGVTAVRTTRYALRHGVLRSLVAEN